MMPLLSDGKSYRQLLPVGSCAARIAANVWRTGQSRQERNREAVVPPGMQ